MKKIPSEMRRIIGENIRALRMKMFPGRGGSKKCAEAFGVSQQQWSPWETGLRTPDSVRMDQMASFFNVPLMYFYENHATHAVPPENRLDPMRAPAFDAPVNASASLNSGEGGDNPAPPFPSTPAACSCPYYRKPAPGQPSGGDSFRNICRLAEGISENGYEVTITFRLKDPNFLNYTMKGCIDHLISQK